jgi:hypothetical protein
VKKRPDVIGTPSAVKYPGLTARYPVMMNSSGPLGGRPAMLKWIAPPPPEKGGDVAASAYFTPGLARSSVNRRSMNWLRAGLLP